MEIETTDTRKRNMERRRETSRYAARDRRGKEADIFMDLKDVVPIVDEGTVTHLDRIALLRVAATVCRLRKTAGNVLKNELSKENSGAFTEETMTECLDGFILIADSDGTILYINESVCLYIGLTQTDLTGRPLREFLHQTDYDEFVQLSVELGKEEKTEIGKNAVMRMKTVISPRGRNLNLKSALYKPVSFTMHGRRTPGGHVIIMQGVAVPAGQGTVNATATALTKFADAPTGTYMTRHTSDMRISYVNDRFNYILKNELKSLMGTSFYDLVYPVDSQIVGQAMKELFTKGHVRTPYYRLLAANGSLAWVMTDATTIASTTKGQKGQYVLCIHYVLGIQAESESLIICTDAKPCGQSVVPVHIKAEIDDTREYMGRQPEIMECVDFTPLLDDDPFDLSLLSDLPLEMQPTQAAGIAVVGDQNTGSREKSVQAVLSWLFREQPNSPPIYDRSANRRAPSNNASMAPQNFLAPSSGAFPASVGVPSNGSPEGTAQSALEHGLRQCGLNTPPIEQGQGTRGSLYSGQSSDRSRGISAVFTPDTITLSESMRTGPSDVFSPMSTPSAALAAGGYQLEEYPPPAPFVCDEQLKWEEPDLSGLAPFIGHEEEDILQMNMLPKDLQSLYQDLPDWTPAEPLAPAARPVPVYNDHNVMDNSGPPAAKRPNYMFDYYAPEHIPSPMPEVPLAPYCTSPELWRNSMWSQPSNENIAYRFQNPPSRRN